MVSNGTGQAEEHKKGQPKGSTPLLSSGPWLSWPQISIHISSEVVGLGASDLSNQVHKNS